MRVAMDLDDDKTGHVVFTTKSKIGKVTIELLDHHRRILQSITLDVGPGDTRFRFKHPSEKRRIEAIHINAAGEHHWAESSEAGGVYVYTGEYDQ